MKFGSHRGAVAGAVLLGACARVPVSLPAPTVDRASAVETDAPGAPPAASELVTSPPAREVARLGLSPFYRKYLSAGGLPIVASARVNDFALHEARYLVLRMLEPRPELLKPLIESRVRVVVIAHDEMLTDIPEYAHMESTFWDGRARGMGPRKHERAVSAGEENLLAFPRDPYDGESTLIHEFAHAIAEKALAVVDPRFEPRLRETYERARRAGLWERYYASTSFEEYWAEIVQSWFDANRENDNHQNHVDTRAELFEYDPEGAALVRDALGESDFRYVDPRERKWAAHLQRLDRSTLPEFVWPPEVLRAFEHAGPRTSLQLLEPLPPAAWKQRHSERDSPDATVHFHNQREEPVRLFRIDVGGKLRQEARLPPRAQFLARTQVDHCFLVTDEQRAPLVSFCAGWGESRAVIRR
jgi:hypothetical protein